MSHETTIQWTDRASNPIRYRDAAGNDVWACVKTSPGCKNCYSEALALRYGKGQSFSPQNMKVLTPYLRDKEVKELLSFKKTPPGSKVFVGDMTDVFGEWVTDALLDRLFGVLAVRHDVTFQILTKRAERMSAYFADPEAVGLRMLMANVSVPLIDDFAIAWGADYQLNHCWFGTSVENQPAADERIPHLLKVPAKVRFLSCEPLLGPVDITKVVMPDGDSLGPGMFAHGDGNGIDWVIVGCESGSKRRPMDDEWASGIMKQCDEAGVPVFVKQVEVGGKVTDDITRFPHHLRVQEFPTV